MLSSMRSRRRFILASVKFLSRALTALNFDPSMATLAMLNRSSLRHSTMNSRHTLRMAGPLSLRKSAMVLKSGASCPGQPDHLDVALALSLQPPARRHAVEVAVDVELEHHPRMIAGPADIKRLNVDEAKPIKIDPVDKRIHSTHRIVLSHVFVKTRREHRHLLAINPLHKARHRFPAANHQLR